MLRRTPILALLLGAAIAVAVTLLFEEPERPFTLGQRVVLFLVSIPPGLGIAMLFDPYPKKKKEEFLKINFYEEKV